MMSVSVAVAIVLALAAGRSFAQAVTDGVGAPGPTVSALWVIVFLALFVAICAWIAIAIWRNERKHRAGREQDLRS